MLQHKYGDIFVPRHKVAELRGKAEEFQRLLKEIAGKIRKQGRLYNMNLIRPSHEILSVIDYRELLRRIESAGRTCYKSEARITPESSIPFIRKIIKSGHESVIEHESLSVRFICDRGVTHELVRHRLAAFSQESTRYCDYGGKYAMPQVTFIIPPWIDIQPGEYLIRERIPLMEIPDITGRGPCWMLNGCMPPSDSMNGIPNKHVPFCQIP